MNTKICILRDFMPPIKNTNFLLHVLSLMLPYNTSPKISEKKDRNRKILNISKACKHKI